MDWKTIVGFTIIFHGVVYAWRREWVLRMNTRKFNSSLNSIGQHKIRKYFRAWFRIGSYATIIFGFPFTLFLFLRTIFYTIFPSIVAVAVAVTPSALVPSDHHTLELHHEQLSPYPDADIGEAVVQEGLTSSVTSSSTYLAIQPILPGWNLPITHLPYYLVAILISVVIHELGHAMASASHKIPIQSVGVSLFGPLIPAAHVELNSSQLKEAPIKKQLDILTAGVWMNIYLALITYFIVPKLLPAVLWPTHSLGNGIAVTGVFPDSGVGGEGGLDIGDVIIGMENCAVKDLDSWYSCLEKIWESQPVGYCVTNDTLTKFNNSEGCCGIEGDNSPTHLCFLQMDSLTGLPKTLEVNPHNKSLDGEPPYFPGEEPNLTSLNFTSYCLPAKPIVAESAPLLPLHTEHIVDSSSNIDTIDTVFTGWKGRCYAPLYSCSEGRLNENDAKQLKVSTEEKSDMEVTAQEESHCFLPRLVRELHRFRIVQIRRREYDESKESVLFIGNVINLYNGLKTTEYVPRSWFISKLFGLGAFSKLPEKLETVLLLTAGLSAGLAVVNMLPIYGLDGYHIVDAIARAVIGKRWEGRKISKLVHYISWIALVIALITVFCSVGQVI